jgi:SAM-dependent methyltransferase
MNSHDLDRCYSSPNSTDYSESSSLARFALALHFASGSDAPRILDLGCGNAQLLDFAVRNEFEIAFYLGYDLRESILESGRAIMTPWRSILTTNFPAKDDIFDLIVALGLISYQVSDDPTTDLDEYRSLLASAMSHLSDDGRLVYTLRFGGFEGHQMLEIDPLVFSESFGLAVIHVLRPFPKEYMIVGRRKDSSS